MRRLVVLPVKATLTIGILLAGAVYMAAEARNAVIKHQEVELARFENAVPGTTRGDRQQTGFPQVTPTANLPTASNTFSRIGSESAAQQPAAQTPAQKPAIDSNPHKRQIIISIPDRQLALLEDGKLVKTYPIAVGTSFSPSPEGDFTIINHAKDPVYRHKGKEIQPGKDNPLGSRWMGLSLKGYGIHGTNVPRSIGKAASHGCFRMAKQDVEDLYSRVRVGDTVKVRRQRDQQIAGIFAPQTHAPAQAVVSTEIQMASAASTESAVVAATSTEQ